MWPLLLKDGLSLPYISCMLFFYTVAYHVFELNKVEPLKQSLVSCSFCTIHTPLKLSQLLLEEPNYWYILQGDRWWWKRWELKIVPWYKVWFYTKFSGLKFYLMYGRQCWELIRRSWECMGESSVVDFHCELW